MSTRIPAIRRLNIAASGSRVSIGDAIDITQSRALCSWPPAQRMTLHYSISTPPNPLRIAGCIEIHTLRFRYCLNNLTSLDLRRARRKQQCAARLCARLRVSADGGDARELDTLAHALSCNGNFPSNTSVAGPVSCTRNTSRRMKSDEDDGEGRSLSQHVTLSSPPRTNTRTVSG